MSPTNDQFYGRIRGILESARLHLSRSVNSAQVAANWLIGREIVEEEQKGKRRAGYGERLISTLSARLTHDFGRGFTVRNLESFRVFYNEYPNLVKAHAPRALFPQPDRGPISRALSAQSAQAVLTASSGMWKPGTIHPSLSWTHYRRLLRVNDAESRSFYEIEAVKEAWSARELERQINSLLYERLALSKDKRGVLKLAKKGHEVHSPADVFKDPVMMEFLGIPKVMKLLESDLEQALIDNLQAFLLELGKGFAFVSRQEVE